MTLNFTDFGLTSAIDPTDPTKVTADAQLRVSAQADSLGLIADYTQVTNANKMLWSRADNKENLAVRSQELDSWGKTSTTVDSDVTTAPDGTLTADRINATAITNYHAIQLTNLVYVSGNTYRLSVYAKADTESFLQLSYGATSHGNQQFTNFDLSNGTIGSTGATNVDQSIEDIGNGWYRCTHVAIATATVTSGIPQILVIPSAATGRLASWAGGTSVFAWGAQDQNILTDPTYLPTTDHPQYAGVNGRRWLVLNGAQRASTTSLSSNIFTATTKLAYIPFVPLLANHSEPQYIIGDGSPGFWNIQIPTSTSVVRWSSWDGSVYENTNSATIVANSVYILRIRQFGGQGFVALDTGAGFVEEAPITFSATSSLAQAINIGRRADNIHGFYGKLGGVFTANTGLAKPNFENLLREYYFARSQIQYDPITCQLVARRP